MSMRSDQSDRKHSSDVTDIKLKFPLINEEKLTIGQHVN